MASVKDYLSTASIFLRGSLGLPDQMLSEFWLRLLELPDCPSSADARRPRLYTCAVFSTCHSCKSPYEKDCEQSGNARA